MASKELMPPPFGSARWRTPALALIAPLLLFVCAAAQDGSNPTVSAEQTLRQVRALGAADRVGPLEQYLANDPGNTKVRLEYARALAILRRFPEALREYRRVLESEPQNAAALVGVAKVASWQGQNQAALETYDRVLARNPGYYDALVGKGFLLLWMGRQEEARAMFQAAQRRHPNDAEVRDALASLAPGGSAAQPAVSESSAPAPGETAAPPETSPTTVAAPAVEPGPGGVAPAEFLKPAPELPAPDVVAPPRRPATSHGKATSKAAAAAGSVEPAPRPIPAPGNSHSPMHVPPTTALQMMMLGMAVTVAGAIAYRTLRLRLRSAPLPSPRRVFELPASSLVPRLRHAAANGARKEGPLAGRVLVVHPQEAVRDFARTVLSGAGAEVLALGRGEDALMRLEGSAYDAMLVSDQLPEGWSGREIYHWLERNRPGAERRVVLALSEDTDIEMQMFLEESRALALSAPFGVSDLLAMTRLAMGRSRSGATQA